MEKEIQQERSNLIYSLAPTETVDSKCQSNLTIAFAIYIQTPSLVQVIAMGLFHFPRSSSEYTGFNQQVRSFRKAVGLAKDPIHSATRQSTVGKRLEVSRAHSGHQNHNITSIRMAIAPNVHRDRRITPVTSIHE